MKTSERLTNTAPAAVEEGTAHLTSPTTGREKARWVVAVALMAALVALFWFPEWVTYMEWTDFWVIFLTEVIIWSMFAVAFNLLMGYTGMVSFGQAAYLGIGGYTAGLLLKKIAGLPFALGLIAAPIGGAIAALVLGYFCIRRTHIYFAMLTLAFGQIVYFTAFKWYDFTGGDNGLIGIPIPDMMQDFAQFYKFVLIICTISIYLLWRIINSPFGKTLTAIRENAERADFIGVNVRRYQLYAFMVAGAFSGLAGALIMINDRSVYPDLAFWTQSTQVLLMSLLGGVYTFFGPIIGSFLLLSMNADITQNYPDIWQLFLGGVLILILYALPGGIMGFIQERDLSSSDDYVTRQRKIMQEFSRKFWYFFWATLFFTGLFSLLQAPETWLLASDEAFLLVDQRTWGIVPCLLGQMILGGLLFLSLLRGLRHFSPGSRAALFFVPLLFLALNIYLSTPLSGILVVALWGVFVYSNLLRADVRQAFRRQNRVALRPASGMS